LQLEPIELAGADNIACVVRLNADERAVFDLPAGRTPSFLKLCQPSKSLPSNKSCQPSASSCLVSEFIGAAACFVAHEVIARGSKSSGIKKCASWLYCSKPNRSRQAEN